jgi:hypothetical protein
MGRFAFCRWISFGSLMENVTLFEKRSFDALLKRAKYLHPQSGWHMLKRLTAFLSLLVALTAAAQSDSSKNLPYLTAVKSALAVYSQFRGTESNLYVGPAVEQSGFSGNGTPYSGNGEWMSGSVLYDDALYENVLLKHDLVRDELLALHPVTRVAFYLFKPRIEYFTLGGKTFIHLEKKNQKSSPSPGYYQLLASGALILLKKQTKSYQENFVAGNIEQRFDEKTRFYALKDGVYHELSNAKSLYALTGPFKNTIRERMKKDGVDPDKSLEPTLSSIAKHYNQLNQ